MGRGAGVAAAAAATPAAPEKSQHRLHNMQHAQPPADDTSNHAKAMEAELRRSRAAEMAAWDVWAGVSLTLLLALALPGTLQQSRWWAHLAAFLLEALLLATPAALATLAPAFYLPRRTPLLTACRLAAAALPRQWAPLRLPASSRAGGWPGWAQFLLFTGALGVNTLPWLSRLPFRWFVLVHAASLLDVARASLPDVCASPAFSGAAARAQYAALARGARLLGMLTPTPAPPPDGASCLERLGAAAGLDAPATAALGGCACRQAGTWLLLCVGFALPVAVQFLLEAAARRAFLRRHCRMPHCDTCAPGKGADLLVLSATAALLVASFCAVAWHLVGPVFPAP